MKSVKNFNSFVRESYMAGALAPLYHTTNITNSLEILKQDALIPWKVNGVGRISFTRDRNLIYLNGSVTFVLDQNKLKDNHSIVPFDFRASAEKSSKTWRDKYFKDSPYKYSTPELRKYKRESGDLEFEETIKGNLKNLHAYLLEIRLNDSMQSKKKLKTTEDFINFLIPYSDKHGIKITDQHGKELTFGSLERYIEKESK